MTEVEWTRLKSYELSKLMDEKAVVILPIASIKHHGPHLPVITNKRLRPQIAPLRSNKSICYQ